EHDMIVAGYNSNGSLDANFGLNGIVRTDSQTGNEILNDVILDANGTILAAGTAFGTSYDAAVIRYTLAGAPDLDYGTNGISMTAFGTDAAMAISAARAAGKVTTVGRIFDGTR